MNKLDELKSLIADGKEMCGKLDSNDEVTKYMNLLLNALSNALENKSTNDKKEMDELNSSLIYLNRSIGRIGITHDDDKLCAFKIKSIDIPNGLIFATEYTVSFEKNKCIGIKYDSEVKISTPYVNNPIELRKFITDNFTDTVKDIKIWNICADTLSSLDK